MSRLALGTAQWGSGYGLTNVKGRLSDADVRSVIETAHQLGITAVDTHRASRPEQGYGQAQARLRPWAGDCDITTKVFAGESADLPIVDQLRDSLQVLGVERVQACLIHDWYELSDGQAADAAAMLEQARELGIAERVGISAYSVADVERGASMFDALSAVQVPASAVDQRFVEAEVMAALSESGACLQVRSVFLQGLLLEPDLASPLASHPDVLRFHATTRALQRTPLEVCLAFARSIPWVDQVIVGVTSQRELAQIGQAWSAPAMTADWSLLASSDLDLLDPRRWKP